VHTKTGAIGKAPAWAWPLQSRAQWTGRKIHPGLSQDVRSELPFSETMIGGGSPVPRIRFPLDVDSPHSGKPPRGTGVWCLNHNDISMCPSSLGWSVSYNLCLRSDRSVSMFFRGRSPHFKSRCRVDSDGCEVRQGRRAFTTDSLGGLSQWHGGRLGRQVSWDGLETKAAARTVGLIDLLSNGSTTGAYSRQPPR
jgi:hypothetical protein